MSKFHVEGAAVPHADAPKRAEEVNQRENAVSEPFAVQKAIHNELRSLERTIDAYLMIQQIRRQYPAEVVENDMEFVETMYRRKHVECVYQDLQRPDCIAKLHDPAPRTEQLIEKLREGVHPKCGDAQKSGQMDHPTAAVHGKSHDEGGNENSLLSRVMNLSVHPLLMGEKASEWKEVVADGEDLRIHVRNYEDNNHKLSFRVEGVVQAPLLCILSVLNEVDLFTKWIPYFRTPIKLGLREVSNVKLGRVDQLVQFHADFPWPFANRDAVFEVFAVDDFERNDQIVVKMITPHSETPRLRTAVPVPAAGVERIIVDGSLVIKPLGRDASLISLVWHENCRMHVPLKMVDFVSRLFARSAFRSFQSACQAAIEGEHKTRRAKNPFLYQFVLDRLYEVGLVAQPNLTTVSERDDSTQEPQDFL